MKLIVIKFLIKKYFCFSYAIASLAFCLGGFTSIKMSPIVQNHLKIAEHLYVHYRTTKSDEILKVNI